jgi:hypothetical protein
MFEPVGAGTIIMPETAMPGLERRLKAQLLGDVEFDAFTRGRYATDASHYQIMPIGVAARPHDANMGTVSDGWRI